VQRRVLQTRFCHSSSPMSWVYFVDVTLLVSRRLGINSLRHNAYFHIGFVGFFSHFVSHPLFCSVLLLPLFHRSYFLLPYSLLSLHLTINSVFYLLCSFLQLLYTYFCVVISHTGTLGFFVFVLVSLLFSFSISFFMHLSQL
jgi:hypothetical protein